MGEATVSFALETIRKLVTVEAKFLGAVNGQVEQLEQELGHIQWFIKDAEVKKVDKERIQEWAMKFREIAYDAEDVLESYAFKIKSRRQGRGVLVKSLKRCTCILNEAVLKHQVGLQIQALMTKISNLKENFEKYGVRAIVEGGGGSSTSSRTRQQQLRRSYSHVLEEDFVGLESDVEMLVDHLVDQVNYNCKVISIIGMGGLGKTTLAQKIYNHSRVKRHFDASSWVCISQEWETLDILQKISVKVVPKNRGEIMKLKEDELIRELFNAQTHKNFIFVLDDIWEINAWESIKPAFQKDSKILLTTRNKEVALHIGPNGFHHQPRLLNEEECMELLQKKSFLEHGKHKDCKGSEDFEALGKEMVKYCRGLPLAVVVLGGILATKHSIDEWRNVLRNIKYFLGKGKGIRKPEATSLEDILALSYDDLPYRLKPCFLYMAAFPEDEPMDAEELYHLWMAEGLVSMDDRIGEDEILINVAERYLGELVERCMVQVDFKLIQTIVKFESCRLHDIMRDLCIKKARDENFLKCIDDQHRTEDAIFSSSSTSKIRRLIMNVKPNNRWPLPGGMAKHARSLQLHVQDANKWRVLPFVKAQLKDYKVLRVLVLDGLITYEDKSNLKSFFCNLRDNIILPKSIGNLSQLRFLSVRESIFLVVPSSLGKLEHLQTLDLRSLKTIVLPIALQNMRRLKYLYLPKKCYDFFLLSQNVLRLHRLEKLEVLENFDTSYCNVTDLSKLTNLRQLNARVSEELSGIEDIIKSISNLNRLRHLSLVIYSKQECSTIFRQILDCRLPGDRSTFSQILKVLMLERFEIMEDPMKTLEKFPNLQKLSLRSCKGVRELTCSSNGFPQLKWLELGGLYGLEKWMVEDGAMQNLSFVAIHECRNLEMIPDGLRMVTSLKELLIYDMDEDFKDRVRVVNGQEGADFHKVCHVPSITIN